ncbi:MAG TPA: hypothetical protein VMB50_09855 [Myxococcales bacterium]|nr:hypothetical protein [Myxococcales bacterium]
MSRQGALGFLVALVLVGCRKPPPEDPAEAAYRHAVELFAKASAETHDLTYRDPRFDAVLEALAQVPAGDELRPKADALALQIRQGRDEGEQLDAEGNKNVAAALAEPDFVPLPKDAPMPVPGSATRSNDSQPAESPAPDWPWTSAGAKSNGRPAGYNPLPDYYKRAGYLGYGQHAASADGTPPPPPPVQQEEPAPPAPKAPVVVPAQAPPPETQGPPPVYGLPGPASHALLGH